jgi:hypothetical protein
MFFEVGRTMVWYPGWKQQSERYGERVMVKILRVARNGIWIEVPLDNGETQKIRVRRDWVKAPAPKPYRPVPFPAAPRPFAPPSAPPRRIFVKPRLAYTNPAGASLPRTPRAASALHIVPAAT